MLDVINVFLIKIKIIVDYNKLSIINNMIQTMKTFPFLSILVILLAGANLYQNQWIVELDSR